MALTEGRGLFITVWITDSKLRFPACVLCCGVKRRQAVVSHNGKYENPAGSHGEALPLGWHDLHGRSRAFLSRFINTISFSFIWDWAALPSCDSYIYNRCCHLIIWCVIRSRKNMLKWGNGKKEMKQEARKGMDREIQIQHPITPELNFLIIILLPDVKLLT